MNPNSTLLSRACRPNLPVAQPLSSRALAASTVAHSLLLFVVLPIPPVDVSRVSTESERVSDALRVDSAWIAASVVPDPLPEWPEAEWVVELPALPEDASEPAEVFASDRAPSESLVTDEPLPDPFLDTVGMLDPIGWTERFPPIRREQPPERLEAAPSAAHEPPTEELAAVREAASRPELVDPILIEAPAPVYPRQARRAGWEGVSLCRITVSAAGEVTGVGIERSSGYDVLDEAAVEALRSWRFQPGLRNDVATEVVVLHSVRFQLRAE